MSAFCLSGANPELSRSCGVADRERERVSLVLERGGREFEQHRDEPSDLCFVGTPVTRERSFDLRWRIGVYFDADLCCCEQGNTSGMAELERSLGVSGEKDVLNRRRRRGVFLDQLDKVGMNEKQSLRKGFASLGRQHARRDMTDDASLHRDESVPCTTCSRVYAQDNHGTWRWRRTGR